MFVVPDFANKRLDIIFSALPLLNRYRLSKMLTKNIK